MSKTAMSNFVLVTGTILFLYSLGFSQTKICYSVGQNTTDHKTGSPTITLSGGIATFSVAQTATNMGVGDQVTYNASSIAYISSKISTTQWRVITATGATPPDVTGQTVNSIAHAFSGLGGAFPYWDSGPFVGVSNATHLNTQDLIAGNYQLDIACYYDTGPDATAPTLSWIQGGSSNYLRLYTPYDTVNEVNASQRHSGKWSATKYMVNGQLAVRSYTRIEGLQIDAVNSNGIFSNAPYSGRGQIVNGNIIRGSGATGIRYGIVWTGTASDVMVINNIIYGFDYSGSYGMKLDQAFGTYFPCVYNNTVYGCATGIQQDADAYYSNNISYGNTTDYTLTSKAGSTNNLSKDATATGTNAKTNKTLIFVDSANKDFHLYGTDTDAITAGADLHADANYPFNTDIDGETRTVGAWDIGADKFLYSLTAAADPCTLYYSVGTSASDFKTGSPTISVTSGTATFSIAQTGNIGVGDMITFNTNYTLYIKKKNTMSEWVVTDQKGWTPSGISGATVNSIKRAFNSLNAAISGSAPGSANSSHLNTMALTTAKTKLYISCYADGNDASMDTLSSTWTTSASYYITIFTPTNTSTECNQNQRHNGVINGGGYTLLSSFSGGYARNIDIGANYTKVIGLKIIRTSSNWSYGSCIGTSTTAGTGCGNNCEFAYNLLYQQSGGNYGNLIYNGNVSTTDHYACSIHDNILVSGSSTLLWGLYYDGNYQTTAARQSKIYNNTVYGSYTSSGGAIRITVNNSTSSSYLPLVKNNYAANTGTGPDYVFSGVDYSNTTINFVYNGSDDGTAGTSSNNQTISIANASFTSTTSGSEDLHIGAGSLLNGAGIGPGSDANVASLDFDGDSRSGSTADIGFDEQASSPPTQLTLADHDAGQVSDAFGQNGAEADVRILRFRLTPSGGTPSIASIAFALSGINGLVSSDVQGCSLYVDANNDGVVDVTETTVGGGGVVSIGGTNRISFSTGFTVSSGTNYILVADFPSLGHNDSMRVSLSTGDVSTTYPKTGSVASVSHKEVYVTVPNRYESIGNRANYTTGTISTTAGSKVVIGSGTAWTTDNRGQGDSIYIAACGKGYIIDSVTSETRLVLVRNANATNAGAAYTILRKYSTFAALENQNRNLVTDNWKEVAVLFNDGAEFTSQAIVGWTMDASHPITITVNPANRHTGRAGTGVVMNCGAGAWNIYGNVKLFWLDIRNLGGEYGIYMGSNVAIRNCIIRDGTATANAVFSGGGTYDTLSNNILYGFQCGYKGWGNYIYLFNNTISKCDTGYGHDGNVTVSMINNILWGNRVLDVLVSGSAIGAGDTSNICGDNSLAAVSGNYSNVSYAQIAFVDTAAATRDLHLGAASIARDRGANLSSMFISDIDNAARPLGNGWEIGADEIAACTNTAYLSGNIWVDSANGYNNLCNECNDSLHPFKSVDTAMLRISRVAALTGDLTVKIGRGTYTIPSNGGMALGDVQTSYTARLIIQPQDFAKKASEMPLLTRVAVTGGAYSYIMAVSSYMTVQGLKFSQSGDGGLQANECIRAGKPGGSNHIDSMIIERNVFDNSGITGGSAVYEFRITSTGEVTSKNIYIRNNIFYKGKHPIAIYENGCCNPTQRDSAFYIVNNTAYDCDGKFLSINNGGGTGIMAHLVAANNLISSGNDTVFYGTAGYAVGPYTVYNTVYETSPTAHMFQGQAATYYTKSICDSSASTFLSTTITDTNFLRPAATDMAVDWSNATYAPSIDIWGNSRTQGSYPDAGAVESPYTANYETEACGDPCEVYYSVGTSTNDFKTSSPTISISSGTATFSTAQTNDSLGVGDEVTFNYNLKCYLKQKISTTQWVVSSKTGLKPTGVSGKTVNSIKRAFNSLNAAMHGSSPGAANAAHLNTKDLVTATTKLFIPCYADGDDASLVTVNYTWTTSSAYYITIFTPTNTSTECNMSQRHNGIANGGGYTLVNTNGATYSYNLAIVPSYTRVFGIKVKRNSSNWSSGMAIGYNYEVSDDITNKANYCEIAYNLLIQESGGDYGYLMQWTHSGTTQAYGTSIHDNIMISRSAVMTYGLRVQSAYQTTSGRQLKVYNNTFYGSADGAGISFDITNSSGSSYMPLAKNNYSVNTGSGSDYSLITDYNNGLSVFANNGSDDGTAGTSNNNQTISAASMLFMSTTSTSEDLHIANTSTAYNAGIGPASDANVSSTDIDGHARSGPRCDIGADEAINKIIYSVGQNTTDHKTGSPTITITNGVAEFSVAQTATNMGVGDQVTYNTSSIAYIFSKISPTQWTVMTATGATPADVTGQTVNSIAHAFSSLSTAFPTSGGGALNATHLNLSPGYNLVTGNYQLDIACYYDTGPCVNNPDIVYVVTGGINNYLRFYTPFDTVNEVNVTQRHGGKWSATKFTKEGGLSIGAYTRIEGFQIDAINSYGIFSNSPYFGKGQVIRDNIIRGSGGNTARYGVVWTGTASDVMVINNIIYGFDYTGSYGLKLDQAVGG